MTYHLEKNESNMEKLKKGLSSFISNQKEKNPIPFFYFLECLYTKFLSYEERDDGKGLGLGTLLFLNNIIWEIASIVDFGELFSFYLEKFSNRSKDSNYLESISYLEIINYACKISEIEYKIVRKGGLIWEFFFNEHHKKTYHYLKTLEFALNSKEEEVSVVCCLRLFLIYSRCDEACNIMLDEYMEKILEFGMLEFNTKENVHLSMKIFARYFSLHDSRKIFLDDPNLKNLALKFIKKATEQSDPICMEQLSFMINMDLTSKFGFGTCYGKHFLFFLNQDLFNKFIPLCYTNEDIFSTFYHLVFDLMECNYEDDIQALNYQDDIQAINIPIQIVEMAILKTGYDISTKSTDSTIKFLKFLEAIAEKISWYQAKLRFMSKEFHFAKKVEELKKVLKKHQDRVFSWKKDLNSELRDSDLASELGNSDSLPRPLYLQYEKLIISCSCFLVHCSKFL